MTYDLDDILYLLGPSLGCMKF